MKKSSLFRQLVFGAAPAGIACKERRAAYAVISRPDGRVAAIRARLQDGTSRYWLPGGGMKDNESPEETVAREVQEELGRSVHLLEVCGQAVQFFYAATDFQWYEMKATFIRARFKDGPASSGEYELQWIDPLDDAGSFFHECHAWAASHFCVLSISDHDQGD